MTRFMPITMLGLALSITQLVPAAHAMVITQLDVTGGGASYDGRFHRVLDRLLDRDGAILMGQYQPTPDIVSPITKGHRTFSLFTSGVSGMDAPSATINGSSITVDLSSLFFGVSRGDSLRAWNIGGMATGVFDPQTSKFLLSWDHLFNERFSRGKHDMMRDRSATFFLQGTVVTAQAPVALSASVIFYVIGLAGIGGLLWRRRGLLPMGAM